MIMTHWQRPRAGDCQPECVAAAKMPLNGPSDSDCQPALSLCQPEPARRSLSHGPVVADGPATRSFRVEPGACSEAAAAGPLRRPSARALQDSAPCFRVGGRGIRPGPAFRIGPETLARPAAGEGLSARRATALASSGPYLPHEARLDEARVPAP
jgi:hypothetical protein